MPEPKTNCTQCGCEILQATANRNAGLCGRCYNVAQLPRVQPAASKTPPKPIPFDKFRIQVEIDVKQLSRDGAVAWDRVEDALVLIATKYVAAFASAHADKQFYGFAFDCNADYGQVFACANTLEALRSDAEKYKERNPSHYEKYSIGGIEEQLRWALGDWEFQAFTTEAFSEAWNPIEELLSDAAHENESEEFREEFMAMACRAMLRVESQGGFGPLKRTSDFKTYVADHDESEEDSWSRLETIRDGLRG